MKNNCLTAIALIFLCLAHIEGQKPNSAEEKKALTDKSFALFQQGKLNDAIELAAVQKPPTEARRQKYETKIKKKPIKMPAKLKSFTVKL